MIGYAVPGDSPSRTGDEGAIAVSGEEGEPGTGVSFTRRTELSPAGRPAWNGTGCKSSRRQAAPPSSSANGSPVLLWYRLDQVPQAGRWRMVMRTSSPGRRQRSVGVEAAVGPHRELSPGPAVAHPVSRRKWAAPSRSRDISTSPVPAAMASS